MAPDLAAIKNTADPRQMGKLGAGLVSGKNSRIGTGAATLLILAAIIFDLLTLIPFVGDFVGLPFWICVSIYLYRKGCGFVNTGRLAVEALDIIAKAIPAIQEFPELTAGMIVVILLIRLEDKTGMSVIKPMAQGRSPLNQGGVRSPQAPQDSIEEPVNPSRNQNTRPLNIDGVRHPNS